MDPGTQAWLKTESKLSPVAIGALLAEETRPRIVSIDAGHIVILRGVNLNPGANPEDMVSIRIWIDDRRVITMRRRRLLAVQDIRDAIDAGRGPKSIDEFMATLASGLLQRMTPVIIDLEDRLDELEEAGVTLPQLEMRDRLITLRRQAIPLRRFLSPQRDALLQIAALTANWLSNEQAARIRETYDQTSRLIENLDAMRERAGLLHEEIASRIAERANRHMYILTIVAAVFLPLGFLTGLLGINVGGIPGADNQSGFLIVSGIIAAICLAEIVLLRLLRWI